MADWKERGFVPDSDEEEDDFDTSALSFLNEAEQTSVEDSTEQNETATEPAPEQQLDAQPNSSRTIADQLQDALADGLHVVRSVLVGTTDDNLRQTEQDDSPLSSLPSSMASSPRAEDAARQYTSQVDMQVHEGDVGTLPPDLLSDAAGQRNLRTRNPIQLHPYVLEDAKYRRLMQARGIRPVQLPRIRDQTEPVQGNDDSQNTESFQGSQGIETQLLDITSFPTGALEAVEESQSPILGARRHRREYSEASEDGLPDLSQILHKQYEEPRRDRKHNQPTSRDVRNAPHQGSRLGSHSQHSSAALEDVDSPLDADNDVFQIPPSPPSSRDSSHFQVPRQANQKPLARRRTPPELPTPLISSDSRVFKRPRSTRVSVSSYSSDTSDSSESVFEPIVGGGRRFQGMTKRIHGVLPASWLRLDMKKQSTGTEAKKANASPSKLEDERGIARIVSSSSMKQHGPQSRTRDLLASLAGDSSDESEDQLNQNSGLHLENQSFIQAHSRHQGEAEEDNQVDQMLPPQPRHRTKFGGVKRPKQQQLNDLWDRSSRERKVQYSEGTSRHGARPSTKINKAKKAKMNLGPPVMAVLDAPALQNIPRSAQPRFVKVAARQARKHPQSSGLPSTKKFFQLATREDTEAVTQAVETWASTKHVRLRIGEPVTPSTQQRKSGNTSISSFATLQPRVTESDAQTLADLQSLKQSTSALLHKISHTAVSEGQNLHPDSASPVANQQQSALKTRLQHLFPHRNRAGQGHLFSRDVNLRPAQLEITAQASPLPSPGVLRRLPTRLAPSAEAPTLSAGGLKIAERSESALTTDVPQRPPLQRIPRKRVPQKSTLTTSLKEESLSSAAMEDGTVDVDPTATLHTRGHAYSYDSSIFPTRQAEHFIKLAVKQMQLLFPFTPETHFRNNLIATGMLTKTVLRAENAYVYELETRDATSEVNVLTTPNRRAQLGPYDTQADAIIGECHAAILLALETWRTQPVEILSAIFNLVRYTEHSLCFPGRNMVGDDRLEFPQEFSDGSGDEAPQTLDAAPGAAALRPKFVEASLNFVSGVIAQLDLFESRAPDMEHKQIIRTLNCVVVHAWQMHAVATGMVDLQKRVREVAIHAMQRAMSRALQWNNLEQYLFLELERFHAPTSPNVNFVFGHDSVEAETVLVAWHVSRRLSKLRTAGCFYGVVASSMDQSNSIDPMSDTSIILVMLSYVVPFTALDPDGHWIPEIEQHPVDLTGWNALVPSIQKLITYFRNLDHFHAAVVYRQFMAEVVAFVFHLIDDWGWKVSPAFVKSLLEVYSFNDLVPFEFKGDAVGIFFNHEVIDSVPDHEKNDYDKFVDMVRTALELQRMLLQDQEGSTDAMAAKELRGLVYSLIPNNAQLYDARDDIEAESFLSLKDHFSLYIALYRSSPEGCGPRIQQLEQQVDLEYSHFMVCKLALRVWEAIANHETRHAVPDNDALKDVGNWYNTILLQTDKRDKTGQSDARSLYTVFLEILTNVLSTCRKEIAAHNVISPAIHRISALIASRDEFGEGVAQAALTALTAYANIAQKKGSDDTLVNALVPVVKTSLQSILHDRGSSMDLVKTVTSTWFAVALATTRSSSKSWFDYVEPRSSLSLDQIVNNEAEAARDIAKQFFFSDLIEIEEDAVFLEYRPLIFASWVTSLLSYGRASGLAEALTKKVLKHGSGSLQIAILEGDSKTPLGDIEESRFPILQHLVQNIYGQQDNPESEWLAGGLDERDMLELLRTMTTTMKRVWIELKDDPDAQNDYTKLVHSIVNELEIYPARGFKLDPWFTSGNEFPRPPQTFENIFKCRFGEEGGEITKSSIVTLRIKSIEALKAGKQQELADDLSRVFCCQDTSRVIIKGSPGNSGASPKFSVDLKKQTQFIMTIMPVYLEQSTVLAKNVQAVIPVIQSLCTVTSTIFFRIDNMEWSRMLSFLHATLFCLSAARKALDHAGSIYTVVTAVLLEYAHQAVTAVMQIFQLATDIDGLETTREVAATIIFGIIRPACAVLTPAGPSRARRSPIQGVPAEFAGDEWDAVAGESIDLAEMKAMAAKYFDLYATGKAEDVAKPSPVETGLRTFAARDLKEGLAAMAAVDEGRVKGARVEEAARAYLKLVKSLPLLPENFLDEDEW